MLEGKDPGTEERPSLLVLLLLSAAPLLLLHLAPIPIIQRLEWSSYDQRMRLRNQLAPQPLLPVIRLVGVSQEDVELLGEDLASNTAHSVLLQRLAAWGVHTVLFDVFFEQDLGTYDELFSTRLSLTRTIMAFRFHNSEAPLAGLSGQQTGDLDPIRELARSGENIELLLKSAREDLGAFVAELDAFLTASATSPDSPAYREAAARKSEARQLRVELLRRHLALKAGTPADSLPAEANPLEARQAIILSPMLQHRAGSLGFANIQKDEDIVRRVPLLYYWRGRLFPNLSLAAALSWHETSLSEAQIEWGAGITFTSKRPGSGGSIIRIPIDDRGFYLVNYREGESFLGRQGNTLISTMVLPIMEETRRSANLAEQYRGALVLVGEVVTGGLATDVEPIPLQPRFPMVGMHANVVDNILRQDYLTVPHWWVSSGILAAWAIMLTLLFRFLRFGRALLIGTILGMAGLGLNLVAFVQTGKVLPVAAPILGTAVGLMAYSGYLIGLKDKNRRLVRDVFLRSVSPRIGEEILKNYNDEAIWGARREITVLFIDMRGYTTLSENHPPAVMLELLESFYDTVSECVFANDGQVNKFLGDAVLALFGALPEEGGGQAERAIKCATQIQRRMRELARSEKIRSLGLEVATGVGINTGEATVGLVGRKRIRIEYTALGDPVNVASRLQSAAGEGEMIIGRRTIDLAGGESSPLFKTLDIRLDPPKLMQVKGRREPLLSYRATLAETGTHDKQ